MTMNMHRAFNARMQAPIVQHTIGAGSYDAENVWIPGVDTDSTVYGVITAGNKFSQFEEGIALHAEDGGARYSNYRNMYIKDIYTIASKDQFTFRGARYKILQESDEEVFGFNSFIIEKLED